MMQKNDLVICAPEREKEANKCFDIYARVVSVEDNICTLDRYQEFGGLRLKELVCSEDEISEYYRPMTEEEKRVFADTMFSRKVSEEGDRIHLGGDRKFEGWERISDYVLDTLAILNESRTHSKDEPVFYSPDQWEYDPNAHVAVTEDDGSYRVDGRMQIKIGEYKEHDLYIDAQVCIYENGMNISNFPKFHHEIDAMWNEQPLVCEVINRTIADYLNKHEQQEKDKYLSIISKNHPDIFENYIDPLLKEPEMEKE